MIMTALLILFLLAFSLTLLNRRKLGLFFGFVFLLLLSFAGSGILPKIILEGLQAYPASVPKWEERNLIIVLGSGTILRPGADQVSSQLMGASRLMTAAQLYFECKEISRNCSILTTGGDPQQRGTAEATVMERELQDLGIPATDIVKEDKSHNTFQNAKFTSLLLQSREAEKIILVTSGIHLRRALLYFAHFKIKAQGYPADHLQAQISLLPKAQNISFLEMALHEYMGILRYEYYNFMGWNG
jgi:uncharacterized SAM-binding protein YcdF (DUF218 family)